jgi:NAD+ synthase
MNDQMDIPATAISLTEWLRRRVAEAGAKGVVYGLSGGLDSALVGALCRRAFPDTSLALIMPCHSLDQDMKDAELVAESLGLRTKVVVLDRVYDLLRELLSAGCIPPSSEKMRLTLANIKPRLRMIVLYYYAGIYKYLVVGGSNKSEISVGYFTKYGDGGSDIIPLGNLLKTQVMEMAAYLEIPEKIITKPPSAGLWENQTDEKEMGITYELLDRYLSGGQVPEDVQQKIDRMQRLSQHKKRTPPIPDI